MAEPITIGSTPVPRIGRSIPTLAPYSVAFLGRIPLVCEPFCEVPHMAGAHITIIKRQGRNGVLLAPYTGWDYVVEFLKAGLTVSVLNPVGPLFPKDRWKRLWRRWQARSRRTYGRGKLLIWKGNRCPRRCLARDLGAERGE